MEIRATKLGVEQRKSVVNADLAHEEIPEICFKDSLAEIAADQHILTQKRFLIVGDQNAGKTTFLHALCDKDDVNSTLLSSFIPAISSSFVNARFFLEGDVHRLMDEPPFLDTDIARTAILMTAENFHFFCLEQAVPTAEQTQPFVVLEFAEFGGDHLDRLLRPNTGNICAEVLQASRRILGEAETVAYFVAGERMAEIQARVDLLRSLNPNSKILFVCTRLREGMEERVLRALEGIAASEVRVARHLDEEGSLYVPGIVRTVAGILKFQS